ncbi:Protein tyrosine phosphatase domain-containing protein 1 [Dermatophagoides farinae]|uniref:Protein tyrosine phosphatase domain-containing protein 1 n=1 Tax=Dermatophagoides farinae TaxID=6954 RepID=A0A922IBN0_DERFA|nr:Protein tyrosine phosphatase domain-containing protein 1 [Dermatophagoides farinae]
MINSIKLNGLNVEDQLPPTLPTSLHQSINSNNYNRTSVRHNKLAELLRRSTSNQLQCSMFCGGRRCKYDNRDVWPINDRAIEPLYSHWITDNILAMARPNSDMIHNDNLIELFHQNGIRTVINLQEPGEHANCGPQLEPESGFTYDPKIFMDNNIYFYNYKWKDFLDISEESLTDMVKVLTFSLYQGRVAIHCHAGLGRTGTLIAGFLIYTFRCRPIDAINFVRSRRPHSIQSRSQITKLFKFANYIAPCFIVYNNVTASIQFTQNTLEEFLRRQNRLLHGQELRILRYIPKIVFIICEKLLQLTITTSAEDNKINRIDSKEEWENFTNNYLSHPQKSLLEIDCDKIMTTGDPNNGTKKKSPKERRSRAQSESSSTTMTSRLRTEESMDEQRLIDALTDSVTTTARIQMTDLERNVNDSIHMDESKLLAEHRASLIFDSDLFHSSSFDNTNDDSMRISRQMIIETLIEQPKNNDRQWMKKIFDYQREINNKPSGWNRLRSETDLEILCSLLMTWLENFDVPILNNRIIVQLNNRKMAKQKFLDSFHSINIGTRYTLEYLARFLIKLSSSPFDMDNSRLVARFVASLAMRKIRFTPTEILPHDAKRTWPFIDCRSQILLDYFNELIRMIIIHDRNLFNDNN